MLTNDKKIIEDIAFELGFDAVGITLAEDLVKSHKNFLSWREKGYAADMQYLLREDPINAKPTRILSEAKSIITLLVNYYTPCPRDPGADYGRVASYAVGLDYHKVIKKKIKKFQDKLLEIFGTSFSSRGFSDAVPFLEKSFAKKAGHGFRGKHSLIINKPLGSYFFIAEIICNLELDSTSEVLGTCGSCTRCADICPTHALDEAYQLDARKCISYHTIENRNSIDLQIRGGIGEWIFGCDLCQDVCPYNKKTKIANWKEFHPESGVGHWIRLADVLSIKSDEEFHSRFCHTPLSRPKRRGLIRNAIVVAGNRKSKEAFPYIEKLVLDSDSIISEHAKWALKKY